MGAGGRRFKSCRSDHTSIEMEAEFNIILAAEADIKWFIIWGPIAVYIIMEIMSGGTGGFGGSDDGFG